MRFERSAVYRDSRRRTAARLEKKRLQPHSEASESDEEDHARTVHFVRQQTFRTRSKIKKKLHLSTITETRSPTVKSLETSPYNRTRNVNEPSARVASTLSSVCRRALSLHTSPPHVRPASPERSTAGASTSSDERAVRAAAAPTTCTGFELSSDVAFWTAAMERAQQEAMDATAAADRLDRDPLADGLIMPETTQSRDMKIFKKILRDQSLRAPFQHFLEQQFCAENLNFYVSVEDFRDLVMNKDSTYQDRAQLANRIFDRHFAPNSMEPVNVDNSTSRRIKETMSEKIYPRWTFDIAQYQIFHLLKYDCWPRFIRAGGNQPDFTDEELAEEDERIARLELLEDLPDMTPRAHCEVASDRPCTSSAAAPSTPDKKKLTDKEKGRSLLWQGFDRFSRKLRGEPRSHGGSPITPRHAPVQRTSSSRADDVRCLFDDDDHQHGSAKRRSKFAHGKQYSMPTEMNSPVPVRSQRAEIKHCRLMTENCSTEVIELNDPTISVRAWTQNMAGMLGMDKKATEAVDAETGSTIDPARQAIDALQSRSVRIVPVVTFAVEILPPTFSFKNPSSTPTKIIMVRARHSLSAGGVLRPLLGKYSIDFGAVVVTFCGTLETIRASICIGNIGPRTLTVMSQAQFNALERSNSTKRDLPLPRDPMASSPLLTAEHNLQFHQHGDVSYCELPSEADRLKFQQKDHPLMKFVRKASAAVTNKEEPAGRHKSSGRRKSVGQTPTAGVYCGEEQAPEPAKEQPTKKRLSIFKNKGKESQTPPTCKERSAKESPTPRPAHPEPVVVKSPVVQRTSNGDTPRTPAIFSSKVCGDEQESPQAERGWQPAAYV